MWTSGRKSGESAKRDSKENDGDEKRDRTSSGAGKRVAKLRRVFSSRKNSQSEWD